MPSCRPTYSKATSRITSCKCSAVPTFNTKQLVLIHHGSDGMSTKSLPITVETGTKATFKADLRLRVQVGAEAKFKKLGKKFGIGAGAAMGIYANLVEFVAEIEDTPTCALETREYFDLNVGAYAKLDVEIDYKTTGLVPTVSTTLLSAPAHTQCWKSKKPSSAPLKTTKKATSSSPMVSTKSSASRSSQMTAVTGSQTRSLSSVATSVTSKYPNSTEFPATVSSAVPSLAISLPLGATGNGNYPVVHTSIRIVSDSQVEYSLSGLPASHPLAFSTLPAAASITPKYSPIPARAVAASLNGPGKYPTVHTSHVTIPCSQAASASSLSSLSKSFRVASPSRPAVANATGNYPSLSSTIPPRLSTVVPSLAAVVPGNGIGRYPFANASFPGNQTHLVTTTLYSTAAYTITVCGAAGVANCPVAYQSEVATTKTIDSYTTICPAGAQVTWPAAPPSVSSGAAAWRSPSSSSAAVSSAPAPVTVTHVIFLTAIPSPKPNTFVPPPIPASTVPTGGLVASGVPAPNPELVAVFAAFVAEYQIKNAKTQSATLVVTPSSSSPASPSPSSSESSRNGQPTATIAAKLTSEPAHSSPPVSVTTAIGTTRNPTPPTQSSILPLTAGGAVSHAVNAGLVLGSILASVIMLCQF